SHLGSLGVGMGNIVIATPVLSDAATITTPDTVASSLPLANLQDYRPSRVARWIDTAATLVVDLGANYAITTAALLGISGTETITGRLRLAANEGDLTAAPLLDTGAATLLHP